MSATQTTASLGWSGVLARGSGLAGVTPTYYAAAVNTYGQVRLWKSVARAETNLGALVNPASYLEDYQTRVTLVVSGTSLRAQAYLLRGPHAGTYMERTGRSARSTVYAVTATDGSIAGAGVAGVVKDDANATTTYWDDFLVNPASGSTSPPVVALTSPSAGFAATGSLTLAATATGRKGVAKVQFYVDGVLDGTATGGILQRDGQLGDPGQRASHGDGDG